jgi:hypothetical protein
MEKSQLLLFRMSYLSGTETRDGCVGWGASGGCGDIVKPAATYLSPSIPNPQHTHTHTHTRNTHTHTHTHTRNPTLYLS